MASWEVYTATQLLRQVSARVDAAAGLLHRHELTTEGVRSDDITVDG